MSDLVAEMSAPLQLVGKNSKPTLNYYSRASLSPYLAGNAAEEASRSSQLNGGGSVHAREGAMSDGQLPF
jgi:hypothetical protein